MKRLVKLGLALVVLILSAPVLLYGALIVGEWFPSSPRYDVFDDSEIILEVMTRTPYSGEEDQNVQYFALADGQRIRKIAPFEPDLMTVFEVQGLDAMFFLRSKKMASILSPTVRDEAGKKVPLTDDFKAILRQLTEIDHSIMTAKIMEVQGRLFVYAELNVNLWDPCVLYQYDPDNGQLTELYTWNNQEPVGLRLPAST